MLMRHKDDNQNDIELSVDDLHKMIDENKAIEIDLDYFIAFTEELSYKNAAEKEKEADRLELAEAMRKSLESKKYHTAFENADQLKRIGYLQFKEEIERCFEICAEHDVLDALVYEADKYTKRGGGKVRPEAYRYLYKLNEMGYIGSFRWLADCYHWGVGCKRDLQKAERLYLEAMLFDDSKYSRKMYLSLNPDLHEYAGDDLLKNLIKCCACNVEDSSILSRIKIGELILDGKIKEYSPETAYVLLKREYYDDGLSYYRLGECILNGIGTSKDPIVALYVLEMALDVLEWMIRFLDDEWAKKMISDAFYEERDFVEAYEKTKSLIESAKQQIDRMHEWDIFRAHGWPVVREDIMEEFWQKKEMFIKRSKK